MKKDNPLNIKVDDRLLALMNRTTNQLDCTLSDLVRVCIELGVPVVRAHPDLIRILPLNSSNAIKQT